MDLRLNEKEQQARRMVCLPLDGIKSLDALRERVVELSPVVGLFKVGKGTFTRYGPEAVRIVQGSGANVFVDLKYNDIPKTVADAADAATGIKAWMFNVHANGGREMLKAAVDSVRSASEKYGLAMRPNVIGVTVLTSIGQAEYLDINRPLVPKLGDEDLMPFLGMTTDDREMQAQFALRLLSHGYDHLVSEDGSRCVAVEQEVANLSRMSHSCGLDGVVCSAADLYAVRPLLPEGFLYITPGIKGISTSAGEDQRRVFSPGNAVRDGSSILVVGRAITDPKTPEGRVQAGYEILQDMAQAL
jgi:orotidine-5'-phosphate decarboxylase